MNAALPAHLAEPAPLRLALLANGYEPVPIRGKAPYWKGWSEGSITPSRLAEIEAAHTDHKNTGIRTAHCVAVDIDLTNDDHAAEIEKLLADTLGHSPLRRKGSKGCVVCYFNREPVPKITIGGKGKRLVEFLGAGQQFAAYGNHPDTGQPYDWTNADIGGEPSQTPLTELPEVSPERIRRAARRVAEKLGELGYPHITISDAGAQKAEASAAKGSPVPADHLRRLLGFVDPGSDRDTWRDGVAAVRATPIASNDADTIRRQIAHEWSRGDYWPGGTPANFTGLDAVDAVFDSMPPKSDGVGYGTLFAAAKAAGFDGPANPLPPAAEIFHDTANAALAGRTARRANHFSTRDEDGRLAPPQWLVEGLIEENSDAALVAPSKFLKTFVGIDIACSIATGRPAFGTLQVRRQAAVFYCAAEGAHNLKKRRVTAWEVSHNLKPYSAARVHVAAAAPTLNSDAAAEFIEDARVHLKDGEKAGLFVIDTMNRALNGVDEDKSSTASAYFNLLGPIRRALGGSTLTLHHMGKNLDKGARGSSAFYAGFDTVIVIDRADKDEKTGCYFLTIRVDKQKDGEDGQEFHLRARRVETPDGASLALETVSEDEAKRAAGKQVGLRSSEVGAALQKFGACPGGVNEWTGKRGGTNTRNLASLIMQARAANDGPSRSITEQQINVLVAMLNRGARTGGPFWAYVVNEGHGGRQWAIQPGSFEQEIAHA